MMHRQHQEIDVADGEDFPICDLGMGLTARIEVIHPEEAERRLGRKLVQWNLWRKGKPCSRLSVDITEPLPRAI